MGALTCKCIPEWQRCHESSGCTLDSSAVSSCRTLFQNGGDDSFPCKVDVTCGRGGEDNRGAAGTVATVPAAVAVSAALLFL
eukprot:m51a1_g11655 hypothetical protein (82) ;mRNA; r:7452-7697